MKIEKNQLYQLELLKHVEKTPELNNRIAASKLGCSVKLAHELLRKMVDKGFFHVKKRHSRKWDYFITPKGISHKAKLTYEFLEFSMQFYREARKRSSRLCKELAASGTKKVSFIGADDLAEIVFLGVKEWGMELKEVYGFSEGDTLMGINIKPFTELPGTETNAIIVCMYNKETPMQRTNYLPDEIETILKENPKINKYLHWVF